MLIVRKVQIVEGFWSMLLISSVYVGSSNDFSVAKHQGPHGVLQFELGKRGGLIRLRGGYSLGPGAGAFSDQSRGVADEDEFFRKFGYGASTHTRMHRRTHQSWPAHQFLLRTPCALSRTNDLSAFFLSFSYFYLCGCTCVKVGAWSHGLVEFQIRAQTRQL